MKKQFQSKSVPRGTRTIWRYLSAFILFFSLSIGKMWANYTPTADEVIILKDVYKSSATTAGYSDHSAIAWAGTASTNSKKAGDPNNNGAATSSNVACYSVKGNGAGKNITISISGCSKIIVYHESHSTRYVELRAGSKTGTLIGNGSASTYYTEVSLDGSTDYSIFLHGTTGSDDQDLNVYAVKLIKAASGDPVAVTGISLAPSSATIKVGKTVTLVPTITPSNATDKAVTWSVTSGGSYASVSSEGVVTGLAAGTAVVTATAHDGSGISQTATITVEECPTSGTLFSMTVTDPDGTVYTDVTDAAPQLIGATYTGGKAYATSTSSSKRSPKITGAEFDFNVGSGGSVAVKVELDCPLAEGDIISFTSTHDKNFYIRKVVGTDLHTTSSLSLTIPSGSALIGEDVFYIMRTNSACSFSAINIVRPIYRTITLEYADGVTPDGSIEVVDGEAATKPADPTWEHHRFDGWYNGEDAYDWSATVEGDLTLTAHWTQLYTITYAAGDGTATGDAPTQADLAAGEKFILAANTFAVEGKDFSTWNDGANNFDPGMEYTMGSANVTLTAQWIEEATKYEITKGTHANGNITIDLAEQSEGGTVTLTATPDEDYVFDAWDVYKTGESSTKVIVAGNNTFTMPAYAVTVDATFAADERQKVLYVTNTAEATVKANDKLYAALKDIYNVKIVGPTSDADQSGYALVVLHESVGGGDYNKTAVAAAKAGNTPVLNTKSYFYNDGRFGWGTPNAGQSVKGATLNSAYCNIADHPLFSGVTVTDGFFEITDDAAAKCMQPVGSFTSGKEGYTLATTPNADSGNGAAIHELTPAQRGASAGKYLLISVSNAKLDALNANGQKLFQNAAAYLIGSTSWDPIAVPTAAVIEAAPTAAYSKGDNISLTASATGVSATTTYTWYKGTTLEAAKEAGAIKAAATAAAGGNTYTKNDCVLGDAGIYWCVISNGTGCEASASVEITVVDASYTISFTSAHGTAPSATTGVSYTLPELTESGWEHQGWTASVNVFVDAEEVVAGTLIANGKMAVFGLDVTFTAVWKQEFQVSFNLNGHGMPLIGSQDVVDGELATEPIAPAEIGWDFGGWFTDAACTAGNEWDFANDLVTEETELFAKWTEFDGCTLLYPATSGSALSVGDNVDVQTGSKGGSIAIVGMKEATSIAYSANGLALTGGGADVISVTLGNDMDIDTRISVTLVSLGTGSRGLNLLTATGAKVKGGTMLGWAEATAGAEETFSYTVEAADNLEGTNIFRLQRNNSVALKCVKVESCGAAIVYHNVTSVVVPAGKGTVALGAGSVRVGHTTTAEFSDIDPLYEFVNWTVSGEGASIEDASANPATITMGTEDAVVTLNLQLKPVKFTVNYYDGETLMGSEEVSVNEHPTAAGIETAKRHYTFQGWSETNGGAVIDLNDITRTEATTVELYAKYEPVACPTSGTIFSVEIDDTKIPASTVKVAKNGGTLDVADYVIISGGKAMFINDDSSDKDAISNGGQFRLVAAKAVLKVELDCALQENDIISIDNNQKWVVSTSKTKTGTYQALTSSEQKFAVTAAWAGVDDLYFLYDGSSLSFTQIEVYRRPALTGASLADLTIRQGVIKTPELTLEPSADAIVTSQVWEIVGTPVNLTGAAIDAATGAITTGTLDDASLNGTITVKVTLNGSIEATCTATVVDAVVQQNVTKSTIWNWQKTGATANIELTNSTDPKRNEAFVLANVAVNNDADFESDKLVVEGQYMVRDYDKSNPYFQGQTIKFNTTLAGVVRVKFSNTGGNPARELYINGVGTGNSSANATLNWSDYVEVPAGEVSMTAFYVDPAEGTGQQYIRVAEIEFLSLADRREAAWVAPGELGTVCLKDDAKAVGANVYELVGCNASGYMVFDQIVNGEIEAGKPYLFEATRSGNVSFYKTVGANNVESVETDPEITKGMYGTFDPVTFTADDESIYYFSGRHIWAMKDRTAEITVPAYRCYVDYDEFKTHPVVNPNPAPGRLRMMIGVNGKNTPTALDEIRQEQSANSQKLLINGQLFILRGEKMYDATGRLVK